MDDVTLTFTEQDLRVLNVALSNMAYKDVANLIGNINKQIETQLNVKSAPTTERQG